jgi:Holliday junction resolvasome RuvABC endonuclease subunit
MKNAILGFDPGLTRTAWAILQHEPQGGLTLPKLIDLGQVSTKKIDGSTLERIIHIATEFEIHFPSCSDKVEVFVERGIINPKQSPVAGGDINLLIGVLISFFIPLPAVRLSSPGC